MLRKHLSTHGVGGGFPKQEKTDDPAALPGSALRRGHGVACAQSEIGAINALLLVLRGQIAETDGLTILAAYDEKNDIVVYNTTIETVSAADASLVFYPDSESYSSVLKSSQTLYEHMRVLLDTIDSDVSVSVSISSNEGKLIFAYVDGRDVTAFLD